MPRRSLAERLVGAWDAVQVELHGQYSLARLRELLAFEKNASTARCLLLVLTMPLLSLIVVIGLEALPMRSPGLGLYHQTFAFWLRCFGTAWVMTFMVIQQLLLCSPSLPMTRRRHWIISVVVSAVLVVGVIILDILIGFPVPFGLLLLSPPWAALIVLSLWFTWKDIIRVDSVARYNLRKNAQVYTAQVVIVAVYIAFNCVFSSLSSTMQTFSSACLPIIKLIFKNWISNGVYHLEDLAPVLVVFNVDTFHALFVSSTMQQSTTRSAIVIAMIVDGIQSGVALYEVGRVLVHVKKLRTMTRKSPHRANAVMDAGPIEHAMRILSRSLRMREHPVVALPRHLRHQNIRSRSHGRVLIHPDTTQLELVSPHAIVIDRAMAAHAQRTTAVLHKDKSRQLKSVQLVLKMLHMVEFYVVLEFVEVLMAGIYTTYLFMMSTLPNRAYYMQLNALTPVQIQSAVVQAAVYTLLEAISFIAFTQMLDYKLRHFSTFRLLSFVLDKHWHMAQSCLVMWTYYIIHSTLEHFGTDFTFTFKWLHHKGD